MDNEQLANQLVKLYESRISGLYEAMRPILEDDSKAKKHSLPFLLDMGCEENKTGTPYAEADLKVMLFGRETKAYRSFCRL